MSEDTWRVLEGLNQRYGAHMGKFERRVWDSYCTQLEDKPERVYYDVPLGTDENRWLDVRTGKKYHRDPWANWRMDALMVYPDKLVIVEVKNRANLQALGQLIAYPILFKKSFDIELPIYPLLVAAQISLPLFGLLTEIGIGCDQVEIDHGEAPSKTYPLFDQVVRKETG